MHFIVRGSGEGSKIFSLVNTVRADLLPQILPSNPCQTEPRECFHFCFLDICRFCLLLQRNWISQVALVVKKPPANAGDTRDVGLIPGLGRSPGGGHGTPLQHSCLENPTDRGASQAACSPWGHRVGHD